MAKKGGGGGGTDPSFQPITVVDPVDGTTYTSYPYMDAMGGKSAAQQLNEHIAQRKQQEADKSVADKAAADAKAAADEQTFQGKRQSAYDDALASTIQAFKGQGVDPTAYMDQYIKPTLMKQFNSIQDLDPNPGASFASSLGETIVNKALTDRRTNSLNQYNSIFNPTYAQSALSSSLPDQYVDQILNEQFDPLSAQLINAQKRGTLTDTGYAAALDTLNQKKSAARSNVMNLGQNILETQRKGLGDYISGGRSDINAMTLGGAFDPNTYKAEADRMVASDISGFGGQLRNAVGGSKFADITDLISAGGAVQGANDPTAENPKGTGAAADAYASDQELAKKSRGLGTQGAF